MKIGTHIINRDGSARRTTVHGKLYIFGPTEDEQGVTHYVADVKDPDHAATFMAHGKFYEFKCQAPQPTLVRGAKEAGAAESSAPPVESQGTPPEGASGIDAAVLGEATDLLKGSVAVIGAAMGKVSCAEVVQVALELESAQAKPRATVLDLLKRTLEGIEAAKSAQA